MRVPVSLRVAPWPRFRPHGVRLSLALLVLALLPWPAQAAYECMEVPNAGAAAFPNTQSQIFQQDTQILANAGRGNGVIFAAGACKVTAQGTPNMTVAVTNGCTIVVDGATQSVTTGNVTIGAAHATLPRYDMVGSTSAGVKTYTAGTAAASPLPPTIPDGHIPFAFVYVPSNDTAINANQIVDKRMCVNTPGGGGGAPTTAGYWTKTADGTLSAEQSMGALATGLVHNTTSTGVPTILAPTDDNIVIGSGTTWQLKALPTCSGATDALSYTTASNTIGCNTIATAGTGLSYLTKVAEAGLSAEFALGSLATGLLINTTTTGVPTILAAQTCTSEFVRSYTASGTATCDPVSLTADVSGDLPYANLTPATAASKLLGRGSASGAGDWQEITIGSGLTMTTTTLSSSGGGGAPTTATYITQTADAGLSAEQALSSLATGYMKVTTGTGAVTSQATPIPVADGGTGAATFTANGVLYGNATSALQVTVQGAANTIFGANGGAPFFSAQPQSDLWRSVGQFGFVLEPWGTSAGNTGKILLRELAANGTDYLTIQASDAMAGPYALILPNALPGSTQALTVTTGGVMGYQTIAGGGDASTNTATSVDGEMALFSGTTGKLLKRGAMPGGSSDVVAVVTSDVTRTNSVTLLDATGLVLPISSSATEIWQIEVQLLVSSTGAANTQDMKLKWTFPTAATMNWGPHANAGTGYFDPPNLAGAQAALLLQTTTASYGLTSNVLGGMYFRGWVFGGGTAGNIQLQFAQDTAAASSSVTIKKGSVLFARKLVN